MTVEPALSVQGLSAWYGPMQCLFDVSLEAQPGQRVALLGRNGAGKTSTFLALMGIQVRTDGRINVLGLDKGARTSPVAMSHRGVAWVPDNRRIFKSLTVRDNLAVAAPRAKLTDSLRDEVLDVFPPLGPLLDRKGGALSGGEQQMLAIGRALVTSPSVLLLDEPTEGLAPAMTDQMQKALVALAGKRELTIVLAEQNLAFALSFCQRAFVLDVGRVVFAGEAREIEEARTGWQQYLVAGGQVPGSASGGAAVKA